jgi:hypothetical protein
MFGVGSVARRPKSHQNNCGPTARPAIPVKDVPDRIVTPPAPRVAPRQGTRIPCEIPITLTSLDPAYPFSAACQIVLVNPHGCAARFRHPVEVGTVVKLEGLPTRTKVTARAVNCISMGRHENFWLLGLALDEPGNVWGIETPPEDWPQ